MRELLQTSDMESFVMHLRVDRDVINSWAIYLKIHVSLKVGLKQEEMQAVNVLWWWGRHNHFGEDPQIATV